MGSQDEARGGLRVRAQLDRNAILTVATQLAASGAPITIRALGAELGADPTALYRHFRTRDDLVQAIFDRLLTGIRERVDVTLPWRERLSEFAREFCRVCEEHPSVGAEVRSLITGGPGELAAVEALLQAFRDAGLDRSDAVRFYAVFSDYLTSVGSTLANYRLRAEGEVDLRDRAWLGDVGYVNDQEYPQVAASRNELAALRDHDIYQMGIGVILDAAESAGQSPQ